MLDRLIFVGFNSRVAALDRDTGELVWKWVCPKGAGYTTVLLDADRLIVSVQGYTYCLNPVSGEPWWVNELPGMGTGVVSLASLRAVAGGPVIAAAASREAERQNHGAG